MKKCASSGFFNVSFAVGLSLFICVASSVSAADSKPLRLLLITGGCCHDYAKQKDILKNGIEERLGPMGLSIPAVISGRDFRARSMSGKQWLVAPFQVAGNRLEVRICLARQARPEYARPGGQPPAELRAQPA